jgi:hypothetical protein
MRFEIEASSGTPVTRIGLRLDDDGDVAVSAGATTLLWLRKNGTIMLAESGDELRRLGFRVDTESDAIEVTN